MAVTYKNLHQEPVPATSTLVYTIPAVTDAVISKALAFNYGTSNAQITINLVQSGGSVADTNKYYVNAVPAGKSLVLNDIIGEGLNTGDTIYVISDTASTLNLHVRVKETT